MSVASVGAVAPSAPVTGPVWLFVRVIDNFGDVGVAWRLAADIRRRWGVPVCLWVDDVVALAALVAPAAARAAGVQVYPWPSAPSLLAAQLAALPPPALVIETFGCDLPAPVLACIRQHRPLWLNWEYLSAEDWAVALHGLPSLQGEGVAKYFWFMGFAEHSGGLLREADYAAQRRAFLGDAAAQTAFRQRYGLPENPGRRTWLLFGYASPVWARWLAMWRQAGAPMTLWLAGRQLADSLRHAGVIGSEALRKAGDELMLGPLCLRCIPFVPQAEFDRLLWLADAAVVRGEDSFVRAQWAGLPFWWHIYPQAEDAHLPKLQAFWQQAAAAWPPALRQAQQALSDELNGARVLEAATLLAAWRGVYGAWEDWRREAAQWAQQLAAQPSAVEKLASFVQDKLK